MSMADREARLNAAVYRTYGVAALWTPAGGGPAVAVTVRHATEDEVLRIGETRGLVSKNIMYVRRSEMAAPTKDSTIETAAGTFAVQNTPQLTEDGQEWRFGVLS